MNQVIHPQHKRLFWLTFGFCLALYLLTHAGRIMHGDDETMYRVTRNLAEGQGIAISKEVVTVDGLTGPGFLPTRAYDFETTFASPGRAGATYSKYGMGQSVVAWPFYLCGKAIAFLCPHMDAQVWAKFCVTLVNPIVSALACAVLLALALSLGYSRRLSLFLALTYGFGTMAWVYTKSFFSEPAVTLLLLLAALCIVQLSERDAGRQLALAGLCLGGAMLFRGTAVIAVPTVLIAAAAALHAARVDWTRPRLWLGFLAGPLAAGAIILAYNWARFASLFSTGYTEIAWDNPFLAGLYGLLFSPGKSVFLYNPALIAAPIGLWLSYRRHRSLVIMTSILSLTYLVVHAPYNYWTGGWNWGPRFLLPIVPFLILALAPLLERGAVRGGRALIIGLALAGLLVTLPAILVDHSRYLIGLSERYSDDYYARSVMQPELSPARHQWPIALDVLRRFVGSEARRQMRAILAGEPRIVPAHVSPLDRDSDRLLWQAELLRNNAPDFWYSNLALSGYLFGSTALVIAMGLAAGSLILGAFLFRAMHEVAT